MIFEYFQKYQKERNIFLPLSEIKKRAEGKTDQYCSIFGYDPADVEHGVIFGPLYIDLDADEIKRAYSDVLVLLQIFQFYGLTDQDYQLCFSGRKGFHLIVYPQVLNIRPRIDLDRIFKRIAGWFNKQLPNKTIDFKVYERRRLWRIPNSINSKSNLFKIPILGDESIEEIVYKAKKPQAIPSKYPKENPVLATWIERALQEMKEDEQKTVSVYYPSSFTSSINPSVMSLVENGVQIGSRNDTAFYIACYLKSKGFSEAEVKNYISSFSARCKPAMAVFEIRSIIRSAFRRL